MGLRARRWARRLFPVLALLVALAFLGRRFLPTDGGGDGRTDADFDELPRLRPAEAVDHVGERAVVCGRVVETRYLPEVQGAPTYLNFEAPYPDQPFTALIWGRHRTAFPGPPERAYRGTRLCVAGTIESYEGDPRIEVRTPSQLRVGGAASPVRSPAARPGTRRSGAAPAASSAPGPAWPCWTACAG